MTTFATAAENQSARTENNMRARRQTGNACTDLFFKAGAMRGQDITPDFVAAYVENPDHATRIAAWLRDVRGGAGERELFRDVLRWLENNHSDVALQFIPHVPELGRWDDLLIFTPGSACERAAFELIQTALNMGDGLAAKWMPREKSAKRNTANRLRHYLGWDSKTYRKRLATLSSTVEDQMCAREWDQINYSHVPSMAHARYRKAFDRNDSVRYKEFITAVLNGDPDVKVNAQAIFPHDVIRGKTDAFGMYGSGVTEIEAQSICAQWAALPNYVGDANILPLVDVSGSMEVSVGGKGNLTCMDVAVALGLYLSEKNTGKFADMFMTFTQQPELLTLRGTVTDRLAQMVSSDWGFNTNLHAAFDRILQVAVEGDVPDSEMPQMLLILSDMNFDQCIEHDDSAMEMIQRKYKDAGYTVPAVAFWNLHAQRHVPVSFDQHGTALISGFSPSILQSLLRCELDTITPESVMMETIMNPRYDILGGQV